MTKNRIKRDNLKTSSVLPLEVRPPHSSVEAPVMGVERRGRQNSTLNRESCSDNSVGRSRDKWKGGPFLNRWLRISLWAQKKDSVFNNLLLHVNEESLTEAYHALDGKKALGVDGVSKTAYGKDLEANISALSVRVRNGSYKPKPKRLVHIPKDNGKTRPIAVACFEDKMVDWVVAKILNQVFEPTFIRNSFGFRENHSAHQAVETCHKTLTSGKNHTVVEVDFASFFDTIPHKKLMSIVKQKIKDDKFRGLVRRLLKTPVMDEKNNQSKPNSGTPQGGLTSPVLANIYLNEAVDQWFMSEFAGACSSIVRYADDIVFLFKENDEAEKFLTAFRERVHKYGLSLNEEKTRVLTFNKNGHNHFNFLGFTFFWGKKKGVTRLKVKTEKKKLHRAMKEFRDWVKESRNAMKLGKLWELAKSKIRGHYNYFGYWTNQHRLNHFYQEAVKSLFKWLNRRSQKRSYTWEGFRERLENLPLGEPPKSRELKPLGGNHHAYSS